MAEKERKNSLKKKFDAHIPEIFIFLGSALISLGFLIFISTSHWCWSNALVSTILGSGLILFGHFKVKRTRGYDRSMKKAVALGISVILLSLMIGSIYAARFDVPYRISYIVRPKIDENFEVILPIPANEDGEPQYRSRYDRENMEIIKTEYGTGLKIVADQAFEFSIKGRSGDLNLRGFSQKNRYHYSDKIDYWVYVYSENPDNGFQISINYDNNAPGKGYEGRISVELDRYGWNIVYGLNGKWTT